METLKAKFFPQLEELHIVIAIIAGGVVARMLGVSTSAVWFDEAVSVFNSRLPLFSMIQAVKFTNSPPLWEIILWLDVHLLGENEFTIRLPSLIAGIFILWLVYKLAKDFGLSTGQRCFALLLVAFLPTQIWAAQDARVYAILSALYLAAIWFVMHNRWLGLTACVGLLMYAHFTAPFYIASLYIVAIFNNGISWKSIRYTLISGLVASLSFVPWLSALLLSLGTDGKVPPLSPKYLLEVIYQTLFLNDPWVANGGMIWFNLGIIAITLVTAVVLGVILLFKWVTIVRKHETISIAGQQYLKLTLLAVGPLLFILVLGMSRSLIYYRPLTGMVIPMILWVVCTLGYGLKQQIFKYGFAVLWLVLLFAAFFTWAPTNKGVNIRTVAEMINHEWQAGDIIYHATGTTFLPFAFYQSDKQAYLMDEPLHLYLLPYELVDMYGLKHARLEDLNYTRVWIVYARDPLIPRHLRRYIQAYANDSVLVGRIKTWHFAPIEVYLLDRSKQ